MTSIARPSQRPARAAWRRSRPGIFWPRIARWSLVSQLSNGAVLRGAPGRIHVSMDWDKLKVFHAAAEAGSFTHAGEQLGLSQSAVSRQVSALEQELAVSLFHRHARGLILTEQGDLLYRTAHDVFMKLEAARTKLTDSREKPNGELRINTTAGIGVHWLTPRLGEFFDLYPDIRINLITSDEELDLAMREADVAIRLRQPVQPDLIQRKLFSMHFHAYASPEYLKRSGTPRSLEDLDRHRIMVLGGNAPNYLQDVHSVCRAQASGGSLPRGRESFFECLHDVGVLLVGLGPGAHMGEAQVLQGTVDRIVGDRDAKLLVEPHDQIAGPPAHNTMDRWDRALFHTAGEKCLVCVRQLARRARGRPVDETLRSLLVEPDHPVPQRLTVHSADLCRVFPRGAVEHRCDRQQPACLRRILHPLRNATNIAACIVRPHRNGSPHGKRPS